MRPFRRCLSVRSAAAVLAAWCSVGGGTAAVRAQSDLPAPLPAAPSRERLERIALAAARSELLERVLLLSIDGERTIGDWLAGDLVRDRALRRWVRSTPPASSEADAGGAIHVSLTLSPVAIRDRLLALASEPGRLANAGPAPRPIDWHAAAARWADISVTAAAASDADIGEAPTGWENITAADRALTRRAAEADARGELLRTAAGLRVTSARVLGDFLDFSDAVRSAVLQGIDRHATATTRFEPDQVAVAEARIALADLIDVLLDAHHNHYTGEFFRREHFREMSLIVRLNEIKATGFAAPPQSALPTRLEMPSIDPLPAVAIPETPPLAAGDDPSAPATSRPAVDPVSSENAVDSNISRPLAGRPTSQVVAEPTHARSKATAGSTPTSVRGKAAPVAADPPSHNVASPQPRGEKQPARTPSPPARPDASVPGAPPWAGRTLLAVGRAPASGNEQQSAQSAAQAALRSLRDQILELEVENDLTVGAVLGYREELHGAFESAIAGARAAGDPVRRADGSMEVTFELPLLRIWRLLETESPDDRYATDRDLSPDEPPSQPLTSRPSPARP